MRAKNYSTKPQKVSVDERLKWARHEVDQAIERMAGNPQDTALVMAVVGRYREWQETFRAAKAEMSNAAYAGLGRRSRSIEFEEDLTV